MPAAPHPVYQLDGSRITDEPSFYAELGRAVGAPKGYYGRNLDALVDCLRGGFGPEPPFTLVWHDSAAGRRALTRRLPGGALEERSYFEVILEILRAGGVTVELR